jgi:hypothetical protein
MDKIIYHKNKSPLIIKGKAVTHHSDTVVVEQPNHFKLAIKTNKVIVSPEHKHLYYYKCAICSLKYGTESQEKGIEDKSIDEEHPRYLHYCPRHMPKTIENSVQQVSSTSETK